MLHKYFMKANFLSFNYTVIDIPLLNPLGENKMTMLLDRFYKKTL